jgi:hypothetical protein
MITIGAPHKDLSKMRHILKKLSRVSLYYFSSGIFSTISEKLRYLVAFVDGSYISDYNF